MNSSWCGSVNVLAKFAGFVQKSGIHIFCFAVAGSVSFVQSHSAVSACTLQTAIIKHICKIVRPENTQNTLEPQKYTVEGNTSEFDIS